MILSFFKYLLLFPTLLLLGPFWITQWLVSAIALRLWFWWAHSRHGRTILFVTSRSPKWEGYIASNILPKLNEKVLVFNRSDRNIHAERNWWADRAHSHWGGHTDHTPLALVFSGFWKVERFRFYQAFMASRKGDPSELDEVEASLFAAAAPK